MASAKGPGEDLTLREVEVLKLIATGLSTKAIARSLDIAYKTAACHRFRIMAKLGIHDVVSLTKYAIRNRYVDLGSAGDGAANHYPHQIPAALFERIRVKELAYQRALKGYAAFLRDRESIGLANPDGSLGARRLRHIEQMAHREYHAALVALKEFLLGGKPQSDESRP